MLDVTVGLSRPFAPFTNRITATLAAHDLDDRVIGAPLDKSVDVNMSAIPEPSSLVLLLAGLGWRVALARRGIVKAIKGRLGTAPSRTALRPTLR